jgi:hypothetical protein
VSAALVLAEIFSPEAATELVQRGDDVVTFVADAALIGLPDQQLFEWATEHERVLVIENIEDFELLRRLTAEEGRAHAGLLPRWFAAVPRDGRLVGTIVAALDWMITTQQLPGQNQLSEGISAGHARAAPSRSARHAELSSGRAQTFPAQPSPSHAREHGWRDGPSAASGRSSCLLRIRAIKLSEFARQH